MIYIDTIRLGEGEIREEYIERMNLGIEDAVAKGMSREYVERFLRRWVPEREVREETGKGKV